MAPRPADAGRDRLLDRFVAALRAEWEAERARAGVRRLETVFIGGGTPSLLGEERLERLLEPLEALLTPCAEVTLETNPDDVTPAFAAWAARAGCVYRSACRASTPACARPWGAAARPTRRPPSTACGRPASAPRRPMHPGDAPSSTLPGGGPAPRGWAST